tara:strand:+ start:109 stop:705 length:597 start_codon:yes stop_codon:yes gene_type:complete
MFKKLNRHKKIICSIGLLTGISASCFLFENLYSPSKAIANNGFAEFQWDQDPAYKKLRYLQSSKVKLDRAKYFFFFRSRDRNTAIIKLKIKVPKNFDAKINPKKLSFCQVKMGGFSERTKCVKNIPAIIEVDQNQTNIEIFPNQAIPTDKKTYALVMKIFNPRRSGMFQFSAFSQSPGDLPISQYLGTWNITIDTEVN